MSILDEPTFFGVEAVNRVSFLRSDSEYINSTIVFPSTKFVFYVKEKSRLLPLINNDKGQITPFIKSFSQLPPHFQKLLVEWGVANEQKSIDILNFGFSLVFLGIDEDSKISNDDKFNYKDKYKGTPVYAVYLNDEILTSLAFEAYTPLSVMADYFKISNPDSSLLSHGKMYLDWLQKYNFCPGCGSKMIPVDAGTRLLCLSEESAHCPIKGASVNNVCFPRTDPVVITCVTNTTRDKILLGLNGRYKFNKMYSCIAGFMEPAETIEIATVREVWEETGCRATDLEIVCSQPWPFPVNLMIGCIAYVEFNGENEIINLNHDKELQDARWFDIKDVEKIINGEPHPEGITIPLEQSIAYKLIKKVVDDKNK